MRQTGRWTRLAGASALVLVLALVAAGCGGGGSSKSSSSSGATSASQTQGKTFPVLKLSWVAPDQFDPGLSYTVAGWEIMWNVYETLITYKHVAGPDGATIIPGLATALPTLSNGGKEYHFTLRSGLKYSDGTPVKASDFAYTIKRLFLINSPGVGFFTGIVGANQFAKTKKGDISGITTDDKTGSIDIKLVKPQQDFMNILATLFAAPVPPNTPAHDMSTKGIPSTGPYMFKSYIPNQSFVLVRNPNWDANKTADIPSGNADEVDGKIIADDTVALQNVINGTTDYDFHAIPSDRLPTVEKSYKDQLRLYTPANTYYLFMNTRTPPFNNKSVREAVNYAIDRSAIVRLFSGLAVPTQNFLPPTYPEYKKIDHYTYDLAKAKQLVQQAGATGTSVKIWGISDSDLSRKTISYVSDQLNKIGLKATPRLITRGVYFDTIGNQATKAQIGWADWYQDYPNPIDWFDTLLNGQRITQVKNNNYGNVNVQALNQKIDELKNTAQASSALVPQWQKVDSDYVVGNASVAPFVNQTGTDFFSSRMNLTDCYYNHVLYQWDFSTACIK
jgi:peptide/nickel transport system substrate-binding protein